MLVAHDHVLVDPIEHPVHPLEQLAIRHPCDCAIPRATQRGTLVTWE
jgi:hypothetical protein